MKTKTAVIGSLIWLVAVVVISVVVLISQSEGRRLSRARMESMAQSTGTAAGIAVVVGWAAVWIPWANQRRKKG